MSDDAAPSNITWRHVVVILLGAVCLVPVIRPGLALLLGLCVGLGMGNPSPKITAAWSKKLLQLSVIGLGFGLTAQQVISVGAGAAVYTAVGISLTFALGLTLARAFGAHRNTGILVTTGTAICGGSAIAAMAPVIKAEDHETGVALSTVFTLNAIGLLVFPVIGSWLGLGEGQFGVWSALAIHDTSSVVGAASAFTPDLPGSLNIATTVKLTRALWILPMALVAAGLLRSKGRAAFPWFLLGFVGAAALHTWVPGITVSGGMNHWDLLYRVARQLLVVTIFLIGCGLTRDVLMRTGPRPMVMGVILWIIVSVGSLLAIRAGWIPVPSV